jgi:hypothetical protein
MPKRLYVKFELPDEVAAQLHEAEMAVKAKETLVMELLREHHNLARQGDRNSWHEPP